MMPISEKEAEKLCNSIEIILVENSYPKKLKNLTPKKIFTRYKNSLKSADYWEFRYEKLHEELESRRKAGKLVPLLPEIKMESFKKKSQLFRETAERYRKALEAMGWTPETIEQNLISKKKSKPSKKLWEAGA